MTLLGGTFGGSKIIDPVALARYLRDPRTGPLFRLLVEDGEIVKRGAQRRVGVWQPDPGDPFAARREARRRGGTLRDSIVKRIVLIDALPACLVGSEDPIALLHHEGTSPHAIIARRKPLLVFWSAKHAKVVRTRSVFHPGTKPNRFLVNALDDLRGR